MGPDRRLHNPYGALAPKATTNPTESHQRLRRTSSNSNWNTAHEEHEFCRNSTSAGISSAVEFIRALPGAGLLQANLVVGTHLQVANAARVEEVTKHWGKGWLEQVPSNICKRSMPREAKPRLTMPDNSLSHQGSAAQRIAPTQQEPFSIRVTSLLGVEGCWRSRFQSPQRQTWLGVGVLYPCLTPGSLANLF